MSVTKSATLHHASILVKDLEKAANHLSNIFSVDWNVWTIAPEHTFVRGKASPFSFRVAIAEIGNASLELASPLSGANALEEYLNSNGEGYHHTCLAFQTLEAMQAAKKELVGKGFEEVQSGYTEGVLEFAYLQLTEPNVLLELLYIQALPAPDKVIHNY